MRPMTSGRTAVGRLAGWLAGLLATMLVVTGCSIYDLPLPGGADTGKNPITIRLIFRDVLDLVPQSTVKVDDVTVGMVSDIALKDYTAEVSVRLPRGIDLPKNIRAEIRQTSLLGEKFISLHRPQDPDGRLADGDVVGLEQTGRNPEIEEVLGALALLLNGGGVAQFRTIADELNTIFDGREQTLRSLISQMGSFMGQLDQSKDAIVGALRNVNRLALEMRRQDDAITSALDEMPAAIASVHGQRKDLVTMLEALEQLSGVGVRVMRATRDVTADAMHDLAPVLAALADSGEYLPKSLQAAITYPFIDAAVGSDPQVARNLHMGDYTNLSMRLNLDFLDLPNIPGLAPGVSLADLVDACAKTPLGPLCRTFQDLLSGKQIEQLCTLIPVLCGQGRRGAAAPAQAAPRAAAPSTSKAPSATPPSDGWGGFVRGLFGKSRVATGTAVDGGAEQLDPFLLDGTGLDPALGTLLLQGVALG